VRRAVTHRSALPAILPGTFYIAPVGRAEGPPVISGRCDPSRARYTSCSPTESTMEGAVPFLPHVPSATSRGPVAPGGTRGVSWRRGLGRATWTGPRMVGAALGLGVVAGAPGLAGADPG